MTGRVRYQVWLAATDSAGNPAPTAVVAPVHLRIAMEDEVPADAESIVWKVHAFGTGNQQNVAKAANGDGREVTMPLHLGHNVVGQTYSVPSANACNAWGPWKLTWTLIGTRKKVITSEAFLCGVTAGSCTGRIERQRQETGGYEIDAQLAGELNWSGSLILAAASAQLSAQVSAGVTGSTCVTTIDTGEISVVVGQPVSGQTPQPPGFSCTTGRVEIGLLYEKYRVYAERTRLCPGGVEGEARNLGTIEVCKGLQRWTTGSDANNPMPRWDSNCPGCEGGGAVPTGLPSLPYTPM